MACSASTVRDDDSLRGMLEAVRLNGVCTMEMVKSLIEMVTKLSSEVQLLKDDNVALKLQLRQNQAPPPPIPLEAVSARSVAAPLTYREVLTSRDGHPASIGVSMPKVQPSPSPLPEASVMASDKQAVDGYITVQKKRKGNNFSHNSAGVPNPPRTSRTPLFGNRSGSSLATVPKKVRTKALFVSRFSPEVTSADVEKSLKEQLELASLKCTKLKTKYSSYSSFHISVSEDDFHLINNTDVWPTGCLITPYYGRLSPDQIYSVENSAMSRPPSPTGIPTPDHEVVSVNSGGALVEGNDVVG
jgi:hypothetical protein